MPSQKKPDYNPEETSITKERFYDENKIKLHKRAL